MQTKDNSMSVLAGGCWGGGGTINVSNCAFLRCPLTSALSTPNLEPSVPISVRHLQTIRVYRRGC